MKKLIKTLFVIGLLTLLQSLMAEPKSLSLKCTGKSEFEIVGSPGVKEEIKTINYEIVNGELQDLNNIVCEFKNNLITCESSFLNFRKLVINQDAKTVKDFIAGNKGFGQYTESFEGKCD
ncbi:MAG: hypothetical protein ACO2YJ_04540 [Methylophilaceae bacterium]